MLPGGLRGDDLADAWGIRRESTSRQAKQFFFPKLLAVYRIEPRKLLCTLSGHEGCLTIPELAEIWEMPANGAATAAKCLWPKAQQLFLKLPRQFIMALVELDQETE